MIIIGLFKACILANPRLSIFPTAHEHRPRTNIQYNSPLCQPSFCFTRCYSVMGAISKTISVFARLGELASSVIVLGLLGRFLWVVSDANVYADPVIIFATVVAAISTFFSIILFPPFTYSFLAFPIDFILFVVWLVAFCLMEAVSYDLAKFKLDQNNKFQLTGIHTCDAIWYWSYWGFYWGGFWRSPTIIVNGPSSIGWAGCSSWRAALAFTFIASMAFLFSSILVSQAKVTLFHGFDLRVGVLRRDGVSRGEKKSTSEFGSVSYKFLHTIFLTKSKYRKRDSNGIQRTRANETSVMDPESCPIRDVGASTDTGARISAPQGAAAFSHSLS